MSTRFRLILMAVLWLWLASGCDAVTTVRQNLPVPPEKGEILFQDDFSDPDSGWRIWNEEDAIIAYHEGGLRFLINATQYDFWSRPGKWFGNVGMEVQASLLNGSPNNDFGLICRYQDDNNFYVFLVSNDGYAGILKVRDGIYEMLSGPSMEYKPEIPQGAGSNRLRAECVGDALSLYVNDNRVATAQDSDFREGDIGLVAGTYDTAGVDILFDDFVAYQP
jgi:hypothetical protein